LDVAAALADIERTDGEEPSELERIMTRPSTGNT
jgi:hypothetical protein